MIHIIAFLISTILYGSLIYKKYQRHAIDRLRYQKTIQSKEYEFLFDRYYIDNYVHYWDFRIKYYAKHKRSELEKKFDLLGL